MDLIITVGGVHRPQHLSNPLHARQTNRDRQHRARQHRAVTVAATKAHRPSPRQAPPPGDHHGPRPHSPPRPGPHSAPSSLPGGRPTTHRPQPSGQPAELLSPPSSRNTRNPTQPSRTPALPSPTVPPRPETLTSTNPTLTHPSQDLVSLTRQALPASTRPPTPPRTAIQYHSHVLTRIEPHVSTSRI